MAPIDRYKGIVRGLVLEYASHKPSYGEIETEAILDEEKGHYQVMHVGWHGHRRVHGTPIHIDVIGDKVWVQYDGTSIGFADELVAAGIPKDHIVLGFKPEHIRPHTGFATG